MEGWWWWWCAGGDESVGGWLGCIRDWCLLGMSMGFEGEGVEEGRRLVDHYVR